MLQWNVTFHFKLSARELRGKMASANIVRMEKLSNPDGVCVCVYLHFYQWQHKRLSGMHDVVSPWGREAD